MSSSQLEDSNPVGIINEFDADRFQYADIIDEDKKC